MSNKRLKEGDIFYVKINEKYIFARLIIDINTRILKKEPEHNINFYSGCYLIEVYKGIYDNPLLTTDEIILPSQFTFKKYFYSKDYKVDWFFHEHKPIDFKNIDFPETLRHGDSGMLDFRKFDISISTKTSFANVPKSIKGDQKYTGSISGSFYALVDNALHFQERDDLMKVKERTHFLDNNDLRLNPKERLEYYEQIEENPDISYYELSLKHGFDLARFYE